MTGANVSGETHATNYLAEAARILHFNSDKTESKKKDDYVETFPYRQFSDGSYTSCEWTHGASGKRNVSLSEKKCI